MTGLDCGLDCWTGLLDWITGLSFELKLSVLHDLHPIKCAELGHMFNMLRIAAKQIFLDAACIQLWKFVPKRPCKVSPY